MGAKYVFNPLTGNLDTTDVVAFNGEVNLGTAAAPSVFFTGDTNTGIYSPGADQVAISTNGTGRLFVGANGNVGVGTASPSQKLAVENNADTYVLVKRTVSGSESTILVGAEGSKNVIYSRDNTTGGRPLEFSIGTSPAARIDSSGRLLVGTSTARSNFDGNTSVPLFQIEGVTATTSSASIVRGANDIIGSTFNLGKTRATAVGGNTVVSSGDQIGIISFQAADGTNLIDAASIQAAVDGTPGPNDMPGRLVFSVTADGASSPTEAMRIKNSRIINIANTPVYADNAAAKTGGLVDGDVYRTSTGDLKIVYT